MGKFQRRSDGLHLTHDVGQVYDLLNSARMILQIESMKLGAVSRGGRSQVDVCDVNGHEVQVTAQCPEQKQPIRLITHNQPFTKQAVTDHLRANGIKVRFR